MSQEEIFSRLWLIAQLLISLGIFFATPIALSLGLTTQHPKKQIVPPLYIQIVVYPILIIIAFMFWNIEEQRMLGLAAAFYPYFVSFLQDKIVVSLVGLSGDASKMVAYSLRMHDRVERILEIIDEKKYRERLRFEKSTLRKIEDKHWIMKSPSNARYAAIIELKEEPSNSSKTIVNAVFYLKERYAIERTPDLEEAARMRIAYLKEIMKTDYLIESEERAPILAKGVVQEAEDDIKGIVKNIERIPRAGWYQTIGFSIGMITGISLSFWFKQDAIATSLIVPFVAYFIFDIPRKVRGAR